eukprot:jgi/Chlat1/9124/Chrsp97S08426
MDKAAEVEEAAAVLVVFARLPVAGRVKTRLAAGIGGEAAKEVYRACAEKTVKEALSTVVCCSEAKEVSAVAEWLKKVSDENKSGSLVVTAQVEGDLGVRMSEAFSEAFKSGARKVVVVGTDAPDLSADIFAQACRLLEDRYDVVLGPAVDGGYYLIGLRAPQPTLFQGVEWSTSAVLARTLELAAAAGLSASSADLPVLLDIDDASDLRRWVEERGVGRGGAGEGGTREICRLAEECFHGGR